MTVSEEIKIIKSSREITRHLLNIEKYLLGSKQLLREFREVADPFRKQMEKILDEIESLGLEPINTREKQNNENNYNS